MLLDIRVFVESFIHWHTLRVQTGNTLTSLRGCAGSSEPSLIAHAISTTRSRAIAQNKDSKLLRTCLVFRWCAELSSGCNMHTQSNDKKYMSILIRPMTVFCDKTRNHKYIFQNALFFSWHGSRVISNIMRAYQGTAI